jgi:hypothetical protein
MPQGASLEFEVREPFSFSNAQKKSVLFGCPGRSTGILPAQLLPRGNETFGNESFTWKSARDVNIG